MPPQHPDSIPAPDTDRVTKLIDLLKEHFPETLRDGDMDIEALKAVLGKSDDPIRERYTFSWVGKNEAMSAVRIPAEGALKPYPAESLNFDTTGNVFIEGENLEILKLLYKAYFGQIKLIYIDPPYNTGNDFVYSDNYSEPLAHYLAQSGQMDESGNLLTSKPETNGRKHSRWLTMMYPRLFVARQLLRDDGVIFVSIDDNEAHHLRMLMDSIFGEENFVGTLIWKRRQNVDSRTKTGLSVDHEYLVIYRKNKEGRIRGQEKDLTKYSNPDEDPRGDWSSDNLVGLATREQRPNLHYDLINPDTGINYGRPEMGWRYSPSTMSRLIADGRILWPSQPEGRPRYKRFLNELLDEFTGFSSVLETAFSAQATRALKELFNGQDIFDFPKPVDYLKLLIQQAIPPNGNDLILDFFAGSGTTAQAVLELNREDGGNRRYILTQLPEKTDNPIYPTIAEITKERMRRVVSRLQENVQLPLTAHKNLEDLGFRVFKLGKASLKPWLSREDMTDAEWLEQMQMFAAEPLETGWDPQALIYEVALREGFNLTCRTERDERVTELTVYRVTDLDKDQTFFICLDGHIKSHEQLAPLGLTRDDLIIILDNAASDETQMNLALGCRLKTI